MLKALILDFDGTILDTETHEFRGWQALYRRHGLELSLSDWLQGVGTWDGFDPWAGLPAHVLGEREALNRELRDAIDAEIAASDLRPGIPELLSQAKEAGLRLAIASSSDRDWISRWLERHGLADYFEAIASRDQVARVKPDPELYTLALELLELQPSRALAVEDSLHGATAAVAAGLRVVVVPNDITQGQPFLPEWPRLPGFESGLPALLAAAGEQPPTTSRAT